MNLRASIGSLSPHFGSFSRSHANAWRIIRSRFGYFAMNSRSRSASSAIVGLLCVVQAQAATLPPVTITIPDCANPTVARRADGKLIVRCGGQDWMLINADPCKGSGAKFTKDAQGNYTLRCG